MSRVSCSRIVGFWETALLDCGRVTLAFYRKRAFEKEYAGAVCCGALSLKPLEGSRSHGGRGPIALAWSARAVWQGDDEDRGT
jgi:hypothetical protein